MKSDFDLIVVGSGFGGTLLSLAARRLGLSVLLIERGQHPRFAIGESTSPLTNLVLEQFARAYDLPELIPFATYGAWKRTYPNVVCGLKRGFSYYHHKAGEPFQARADRSNQLLVAASPNDEVADTHWLRSDVDAFFLDMAIRLGVDYTDRTVATLERIGEGGATVSMERDGEVRTASGSLLIDATGPRGFLHRALSLTEEPLPGMPPTRSLFSHFTGVRRTETMEAFAGMERPPYPPDDAALHHVFEGGWTWVLRFDNGVTSAGISVEDALADRLGLSEGAPAWERYLDRFPTIREQFADAEAIREFTYAPRLSYSCTACTGEGWVMLPSAAAFVDPLFSTGIPLTLIGVERLARILGSRWGTSGMREALDEYAALTLSDARWTAEFVGSCFAGFGRFPLFAEYSMFYFAAASFSEMARRLEKRSLAARFLAQHRDRFAGGLRACGARLRATRATGENCDSDCLALSVRDAIREINIAGLSSPGKRNWYGVEWQDLIDGAPCLGMTPDEMVRVLTCAEWAAYP